MIIFPTKTVPRYTEIFTRKTQVIGGGYFQKMYPSIFIKLQIHQNTQINNRRGGNTLRSTIYTSMNFKTLRLENTGSNF